MFEIECDLFTKNPKGDAYKEMDKWLLIDTGDIIKPLEDPEVVKVTSNRSKYIFKANEVWILLCSMFWKKFTLNNFKKRKLVLKIFVFIMEYFNGKMVCATFVYNKENWKRIRIKKTVKGKKNLGCFFLRAIFYKFSVLMGI